MGSKYSRIKNSNLLIFAIALGLILNPLNTTMITVALPAIQSDFSTNAQGTSWLIASYFIVSAMFLPLLGKISDYYGRKKMFITGLIFVFISSILAPLSPNMPILLGMRAIQAVGTSALYPAGIGIVREYIQTNQNRSIAFLSLCATTTAAFGPTISGVLLQYSAWPIIFYVNFPVILVAFILVVLYIPKDQQKKQSKFHLDIVGFLSFGAFITFWVIFLQSIGNRMNIWALLLALAITLVFILYEKNKSEPFINITFLRKNLNVTFIYTQYILATFVFIAILFSMPTYFQVVLGLNESASGLMMLALCISNMMVTPFATRWMERIGFRVPLLIGAVVGIMGVLLIFIANERSILFVFVLILVIIGMSNGFLNIGLQNFLYSFVTKEKSGTASGLLMTSRFIGSILASSIYGTVFAIGVHDGTKNLMGMILLIVSLVMIPGIAVVTGKYLRSGKRLS